MIGFGLGLRTKHYTHVLENRPKVDWFEIISENFMIPGGKPLRILREIREHYTVIPHGVSMSIGSPDALNETYLIKLRDLVKELDPPWFSDHLCWAGLGSHYAHDLLPLPYTSEALERLCRRIDKVQNLVGRTMLLENVSSYVNFKDSEMTEWEFLSELTRRSGCKLLFDVNNIYVSGRNHGFDPIAFIDGIPKDAVQQFHLAGHTDNGDHVIDTHDQDVCDPVWELYKAACLRFGPTATMIERDGNIPEFDSIFAEMNKAKRIQNKLLKAKNEKLDEKSRRHPKSVLEAPSRS